MEVLKILLLLLMNNISDEKMCEPILYMRRRPSHSDLEQTEHGRQWEPGQQQICRFPYRLTDLQSKVIL